MTERAAKADTDDAFDIDTPPKAHKGRGKPKDPGVAFHSPLRVGNKVFIRSVTLYYTGEIVGLSEHEIVLSTAAWIADTGRYSDMLKNGAPSEIEPYPDGVFVSVGRGAVVDVCDWRHALPRGQK